MRFFQDELRDRIRLFGSRAASRLTTAEERAWLLISMREAEEALGELVRVEGWEGHTTAAMNRGSWPYTVKDIYDSGMRRGFKGVEDWGRKR